MLFLFCFFLLFFFLNKMCRFVEEILVLSEELYFLEGCGPEKKKFGMYLGKRASDLRTGQWGLWSCFLYEHVIYVFSWLIICKPACWPWSTLPLEKERSRVFCTGPLQVCSTWSFVSSGSWAVCLQFLCYLALPLFLSFLPLISFLLTFVLSVDHFLSWLFPAASLSEYF